MDLVPAWQAALDRMHRGVLVCDGDGRVCYINAVAVAITGWTSAEALGRPWAEVLAEADGELVHIPTAIAERESPSADRPLSGTFSTRRGERRRASVVAWALGRVPEGGAVLLLEERPEGDEPSGGQIPASYLHETLNRSPVVVVRWTDGERWPLDFVSAGIGQFGYAAEDFLSRRLQFRDIVHADDRDRVQAEVSRNLGEGVDEFRQEYRILTARGEVRWIEDRTWTPRSVDGRPLSSYGVLLDVTERKLSEEAIAAGERRYELATRAGKVGVWELDCSTGTVHVEPNPQATPGFESVEPGAGLGRWFGLLHPEDAAEVRREFEAHLSGETPELQVEHRVILADGGIRWILTRGTAVRDESGRPLRVLGTGTDITDRKSAEQALLASDERFRSFVERANDVVFFLAPDLTLTYISPNYSYLVGRDPSGFLGKSALSLLHPDDAPGVEAAFAAYAEDQASPSSMEYRVPHGDGQWRWHVGSISCIWAEDGTIAAYVGIARNIDEQKRAEERERRTAAGLRAVIAAADELIACADTETLYRRAVELARTHLGLERCSVYLIDGDTLQGTYGTDLHAQTVDEHHVRLPFDEKWDPTRLEDRGRPAWGTYVDAYVETEGTLTRRLGRDGWIAYTYIGASETPVGVLFNDAAISGAEQDPAQQDILAVFCSVLGNIIRRRQVEESLLESQERFRTFIEQANDIILFMSMQGEITYASANWSEMLGHGPDAVIGRHFSEFIHPDDVEHFTTQMDSLAQSGTPRAGVACRAVHADGSLRWYRVNAALARNSSGVPVGVVGIARDVTREHQVEQLTRVQRDLAIALSSESDLYRSMGLILAAALQIEGVDSGAVYIADEHDGSLHLAASAGLSDRFLAASAHYDVRSVPARLAAQGHPIYSHIDAGTAPDQDAAGTEGLKGFAMVPVAHENRVLAVLNVSSHSSHFISADARNSIEAIAAQVGAVLGRVRADEAVRQSQEDLETLFGSIEDACLVTGLDGRILATNPAAERLFRCTASDLVGLDVSELHPPARRAEVVEAFREMLAGHRAVCTIPILTRDGRVVPVETKIARGTWRNQPVLFGISRDITERARAEDAQRLASVGQLAAGVAHEFNNILASMRINAQVATTTASVSDYEELAQLVLKLTARGGEICRNLTAFARPQQPRREEMHVEQAIEAALAVAAQQISTAGIAVDRDYRTLAKKIRADRGQLEQVFLNLIINACQAMPDGGVLTVETKHHPADDSPGTIVVTIRDTGVGIAPEHLPRVFEPFFTTKGRLGDSDVPGTGLGLSVSHGIITAHGGTIEVHSQPGAGATFVMNFAVQEPATPVASTPPPPAPPDSTVAGLQILLVEDETDLQRLLFRDLTRRGCRVSTAGSASEASSELAKTRFDLIVTDILMPAGNGHSVIEAARGLDDPPPIIVITGRSEPAATEEMAAPGVSAVIRKPFDIEQLVAAIERAKS